MAHERVTTSRQREVLGPQIHIYCVGMSSRKTFGVLLTQAALLVPQYVAAEATLSFFGLGVSEPVPSWGNMLSTLQQYNVLVSYGWLLAPAGAGRYLRNLLAAG